MTFSSEQYSSNLIAEQFYDLIEMGRVYLISKGSLKPAQKSGKSFSSQLQQLSLLQIEDHTGLAWVTDFQESGEDIMGMSTKELYLLKYEEQDDAQFGEIVRRVLFSKFLFKLKVKEESFNDEQRVKIPVIKTKKVNFTQESMYLLSLIDKSSNKHKIIQIMDLLGLLQHLERRRKALESNNIG
ncbi:hypothetical protein H6P81_015913 [Aristolochia fimbriata]|uniref:Replication factor A C-terminal domain-containing protein n=1 Tax=Aristolochia fimbriata TaxID=158543 RepID=A0AAV7EBG3_ARIFI|nr:hypothetical protein H6P81_015913 [Aristolochia fimbriata]